MAEGRKHSAMKFLPEIPSIGSICGALLISWIQTPLRFRTKRCLWEYSGPALEARNTGEALGYSDVRAG